MFMEWELEKTPEMFQALASDMAHAARWLGNQRGIDLNRIGLMGGSQAGWIMPLAASQEPVVRFVIVGEGVPLPAAIEEVHGGYLDLVGNEGNPTLRQVTGADATALDYDGSKGYDPAQVLERLEVPVLWIFGLYDGVIPVRQSIDRIGQLQRAGRRNHALHIFPFGNHDFQNVFTGEGYDVAEASRAWLRRTGLMDREYLEELKNGVSDDHARIAWTRQILEARLSPLRISPADLRALTGRYAGNRRIFERAGKLFYRRADGLERELVPLARDLFALGEASSVTRMRFERANGVVRNAVFVTATGPGEVIAREGS
jgi:dienelactone hydrolase